MFSTLINKKVFDPKGKYDQLPERMIVLQTRTIKDDKSYRFFEVDDNSVNLMEKIPIDEDAQAKMNGQFR